MFRLFRDPFTLWLESRATPITVYQPAGLLGAPPVGWKITVGQSTLIYRVPEESPQTLIIVLFERQTSRHGLRSPFFDIARFVTMVKKSGAPIQRIQGHVEAVDGRPADTLENQQLLAFYQRHLNTTETWVQNGLVWVGGDLRTYVPPLSTIRSFLTDEPGPTTEAAP